MTTHDHHQQTRPSLANYLFENSHNVFLLDGGTGEELFRHGVPDDRTHWSAEALMDPNYHSILYQVHDSFLQAGSSAVTTNSYGCVPGVGFTIEELQGLCATAGRIARSVVHDEQSNAPRPLYVLGSLGPLVESYRADTVMEHEQGVFYYETMCSAMLPFVDCFLAETMSSVEEATQAIDAISRISEQTTDPQQQLPCMVSFSLQSASARLWSDESPCHALDQILEYCNTKQVQLLGVLFNCATPEAITWALEEMHNHEQLRKQLQRQRVRLGAYANRLTPVPSNWSLATHFNAPQPLRTDLDPNRYYNDFVKHWVTNLGVGIVGGCCGVTPEHVSLLRDKLLVGPRQTQQLTECSTQSLILC
ncbi:hypothetical protein MPSEU_000402200 [Mayamaea pseudoterrestris]|nr:hypothetical protein MPSEU_000402200 [Mayamaea pseudoterrestris]